MKKLEILINLYKFKIWKNKDKFLNNNLRLSSKKNIWELNIIELNNKFDEK